MVLIIPSSLVSDPSPGGKGFLVTQQPRGPHLMMSVKKTGEPNRFLLFFELFPLSLERFSSSEMGRQTCVFFQGGRFCFY